MSTPRVHARPQTVRRRDAAAAGVEPVTVHRRDLGELRAPVKTPQGFLLMEGVAAIAGVYPYVVKDASGQARIVRELVDADVIRDYAGQLARNPLTLRHPQKNVSRDNAAELVVGDVGEVVTFVETAQGGFAKVAVCVRRGDAIDAVEQEGIRQLSCGYDAVVDPTPGIHPIFGPYDQRQTKRKDANHLALVPNARHGSAASLRVDDADLSDVPEGMGVQLGAHAFPAAPTSTHTDHHEDAMNPSLLALAAILGVKRTDGMSDDDYGKAIIAAAQKAQEDAARNRTDAADKARQDGALKHVTDMFKAKLKDAEGFSEDLPVEKMADMMGAAFEKLKGERDSAKGKADAAEATLQKQKDDAARADLRALVKAKGLQVEVKDDAALPALRRLVAEAIVGKDRLKADASDDYITGILDMNRPQHGQGGSHRDEDDSRYAPFQRRNDEDEDGGKDGKGRGQRQQRRDQFYDPTLESHDEAFQGAK